MKCVLFAKVDQVLSLKKNIKNGGNVREFCQSGKVGNRQMTVTETNVKNPPDIWSCLESY